LRPPFVGNPLEIGDEIWRQKTSLGATRWWRNYDASCLRFDTIPARDGQTDRQTDRQTCCDPYYPR